MALNRDSNVSVESWIEMTGDVDVRCEVDQLNDRATLYFGHHNEYVMVICRESLGKVVSLGTQAMQELDADLAPSS